LEHDVMLFEHLLRSPQLLIVSAQRTAAISRNVSRGVVTGRLIAQMLHQGQAYQRLRAGDENTAGLEPVFVVERNVAQRHGMAVAAIRSPA
jgi:hypothetical protein